MAQVLVLADDLTGANATGARFARAGLRVASVPPEQAAVAAADHDVVVANLDSRHLPAEQAADLVTDVVEAVWPVGLVVKRTDSTLRGNVGAEVEAALRAVGERAGAPVRALMVPALPSAGRVTAEGVQLLDGQPLERTEVAADPFCPMDTGDVAAILARQTALAVRRVPVRQVTRELLTADLTAGNEPVVLCDAFDESRIEDIAEAAAAASRDRGAVWVAVDPGPAGAALAAALRLRGRAEVPGPLLAVMGSPTAATVRQLETVARTGPVRYVDVDPVALCTDGGGHAGAVAEVLADRLTTAVFPEFVVVRLVGPPQDGAVESAADGTADSTAAGVPNGPAAGAAAEPGRARSGGSEPAGGALAGLDRAVLWALPSELAACVARAVRDVEDRAGAHALPTGLYLTGGDLAAHLLDELGVRSFAVAGEIVPLAVHGVLGGGPLDGVPAVTKGGLVGDATTAVECFGRLRRAAQARLHQVDAEVPEHIAPAPFRA